MWSGTPVVYVFVGRTIRALALRLSPAMLRPSTTFARAASDLCSLCDYPIDGTIVRCSGSSWLETLFAGRREALLPVPSLRSEGPPTLLRCDFSSPSPPLVAVGFRSTDLMLHVAVRIRYRSDAAAHSYSGSQRVWQTESSLRDIPT